MSDYSKFTAMLASEFHRYLMEDEKRTPKLPENVLLIFEVDGEDDFNRWHKEMSIRNKEADQPVAYVHLKKWRLHSSIEDMTIIGATAQRESAALPQNAKNKDPRKKGGLIWQRPINKN